MYLLNHRRAPPLSHSSTDADGGARAGAHAYDEYM